MKKIVLPLLFVAILSGCSFVGLLSPIVTGVVIWKEGRAHKYYDLDMDVVHRSVRNTIRDMNMTLAYDAKVRGGWDICGRSGDSFYFSVRSARSGMCDLSLRVNTFGNKSLSEAVIKKVDDNVSVVNFDDLGRPVKSTDPPADGLTDLCR